jgi:hypothetical protein
MAVKEVPNFGWRQRENGGPEQVALRPGGRSDPRRCRR